MSKIPPKRPIACVYLSADTATEVLSEAARLNRSISSVMQEAWLVARARIREIQVPA